jgi:1-acyl-sn-glycerol-3-phosphate acyltransferase
LAEAAFTFTGGAIADRAAFCAKVASGLAEWGAGERHEVERAVELLLRDTSDAELAMFAKRLAETGATWGFHPADLTARAVSRLAHSFVLSPGSGIADSHHLAIAATRPVFLVANHLSYVDANVLDALLVAEGHGAVADRMTVLVGPKVYMQPVRRLASLCFGAIKIPQSQSRASGEAVMPRREVAQLAMQTLESVAQRYAAGDHVLIFNEGTRSRTGAMQRMLAASARYFEVEGAVIVPLGLWGTERLVPLDSEKVRPAEVFARAGRPVDAAGLFARAAGRRPVFADALGFLIADLLPPEYRGEYGVVSPALEAAREAALPTEAAPSRR